MDHGRIIGVAGEQTHEQPQCIPLEKDATFFLQSSSRNAVDSTMAAVAIKKSNPKPPPSVRDERAS
jgi:hypothetical protein